MVVQRSGWIGVDLDGTTFEYHGWVGWNVFGAPIAPMIDRIRAWAAEGREVKIVTARVGLPIRERDGNMYPSVVRNHVCLVTNERFSDDMMVRAIHEHCQKYIGFAPQVQCYKDVDMIELWDDRAVQVVPNTGRTLAEEHEAVLSALEGKGFGS